MLVGTPTGAIIATELSVPRTEAPNRSRYAALGIAELYRQASARMGST